MWQVNDSTLPHLPLRRIEHPLASFRNIWVTSAQQNPIRSAFAQPESNGSEKRTRSVQASFDLRREGFSLDSGKTRLGKYGQTPRDF